MANTIFAGPIPLVIARRSEAADMMLACGTMTPIIGVVTQWNSKTGAIGNWRLTWLAVFIVAWTQVAIAGHQFEHTASAVADTCETCVQLERAGGALVPALADAGLFSAPAVVAVPATGTPSAAAAAAYSPRAPPVL